MAKTVGLIFPVAPVKKGKPAEKADDKAKKDESAEKAGEGKKDESAEKAGEGKKDTE